MRITFLLTQSLESPSGLGRYWPLAKEMARLGHQVDILALHHDFRALDPRHFWREGVEVRYVGQMHVLKRGNRKLHFSPARLIWIASIGACQLTRYALQTRADLYQVAKPHPMNSVAAWLAARCRNARLWVDCDDYEAESNRYSGRWQQPIVRWFEEWMPRQATGVTVNTRFLQERYATHEGVTGRVLRVPNGVDRERFKPVASNKVSALCDQHELEGKCVVAFVGTMSLASHPVDLLIDAFALVRQRISQAVLLLVGGGDDFNHLQELVGKAGLGNAVRFAGRVNPAQVPAYFALADVSVDPVHDDMTARARCPLKILESLAMGTPVVTGDAGDRREILQDGAAGKLVAPGHVEALADGITHLLLDSDLRVDMGHKAREAVQAYFWDKLVNQFLKAYE